MSYAARTWWTGRDSNPHKKFAGLLCCRLHHQPEGWWLWVELNHQPRAYETLALFPFELHSHNIADCKFPIADFKATPTIRSLNTQSTIGDWQSAIGNAFWSGREADDASSNSTLPNSHRSARMSHAPITCERMVPKEGLKPSTSGL